MAEGTTDMNFSDSMYYKGTDVMLKISNYLPPMREELSDTMLSLNTWNRDLRLPEYFYKYFMDIFMLPAYTCDKLDSTQMQYPGLKDTYSCYCNNGDYHTMPTFNFEIRDKDFQYDLDPSAYMYLPYLNYTQPMSLCVLGVQETAADTLAGIEYISLGQRALATFPFYSVYDRETNTAEIELGGAVALGTSGKNGPAAVVAIAVCAIIVIMLIYLIALRYIRIKAEEWYRDNKHVLFPSPIAAKLKSEHDILKKLIDGKQRGMSHDQRAAIANKVGASPENFLSHSSAGSERRTNSMNSNGS